MCEVEWSSEKPPVSLRPYLEAFSESYRMTIKITIVVLEIKPCGLGSRIRDMEAEWIESHKS